MRAVVGLCLGNRFLARTNVRWASVKTSPRTISHVYASFQVRIALAYLLVPRLHDEPSRAEVTDWTLQEAWLRFRGLQRSNKPTRAKKNYTSSPQSNLLHRARYSRLLSVTDPRFYRFFSLFVCLLVPNIFSSQCIRFVFRFLARLGLFQTNASYASIQPSLFMLSHFLSCIFANRSKLVET